MAEKDNSDRTEEKQVHDNNDSKDLERLLTAVIKGRTTVPNKCIILHKQIVLTNRERLENAKVKLRESKEKENFKRTVQEIKRLKSPNFSVRDLLEVQDKFDKCLHKTKKINDYLKRRR